MKAEYNGWGSSPISLFWHNGDREDITISRAQVLVIQLNQAIKAAQDEQRKDLYGND